MQITRTKLPTQTVNNKEQQPKADFSAPQEVSIQDVVYVRKDAVETPSTKRTDWLKAAKVGSAAILGGAAGGVPVVGVFSNLAAAGGDETSDTTSSVATLGGALNAAGSFALLLTQNPLFMIPAAVGGVMAWGLQAAEQG